MAAFITNQQLTDFTGLTLTAARATLAIDAACDICRTVADQTFDSVTDDVWVTDGTGTEDIVLPELPVNEVVQVIEDEEVLVEDDDYVLADNGILKRLPSVVDSGWSTQTTRRRWSVGRQNVVVTYDHGYATIPNDLKMVALSIAARLYSQPTGAVFESLGQYSVRYEGSASDVTKTEMLVLQKYRRGHYLRTPTPVGS